LARFPLGVLVLLVLMIVVYLGLAHRLLDRLRLTDKGALLVLGALLIGSFVDIPISKGLIKITLNIGGALVPIALAIYLLLKAGTRKEWVRALVATLITAAVVFFLGSIIMQGDPSDRFTMIDPLYIYPIVGGLTAYLLGRSRRAAFIAATLGVLSQDIIHFFWLWGQGIAGNVHLGGGGMFDSIVLAGLIAILLAELIGESRERLQGGPVSEGRDPDLLRHLKSDQGGEE
jgi:uncharacterized membrane protein